MRAGRELFRKKRGKVRDGRENQVTGLRERVQEGARQEACRACGMLPSVRLPWTFEEGCARE